MPLAQRICWSRSPYPHARLVSIDRHAALAMPGVLAILTAEDALAEWLSSFKSSGRKSGPTASRTWSRPTRCCVRAKPVSSAIRSRR